VDTGCHHTERVVAATLAKVTVESLTPSGEELSVFRAGAIVTH